MGKTLVIAEKPSVARELARVLGVAASRGRGSLEDERYAVTWAVGHLVNIAEPELQDSRWAGRWSLAQLPMIPRRFVLGVLPKTADQFETVKRLMTDERIDLVVNATDAGREGELIFRRIYVQAGCTKPIRRLWASDMTEEGLRKAFDRLVDGEEKRNLGLAAFARAEADWLVGMNFSRLMTVAARTLVTVGRVQTPVLKLLVDRRRDIENFVPRDYWTVDGTFGAPDQTFAAQWHAPPEYKETRVDALADAENVAGRCRGGTATVVEATHKKGSQKPPLPYDLTTLQRDANKRAGFSAQHTLELAQSLYEQRKALTYPRTDSSHLTKEIFGEILDHLRAVHGHFPDLAAAAAERIKDGKSRFECVDDSKVTDHHAIIPTAQRLPRERFSADEWVIYEMVCRRFMAAFLPPVAFRAATVWLDVAGERFKATGKVFEDRGWLAAEPWRAAEDNPLPPLKKNGKVPVASAEPVAHKTKPPAHYTDASLLGAMETAGKLVDDPALRDAMKERGLGTPATRAQVIETLLSREYVRKKGKTLIATDKGTAAIDTVTAHLAGVASPELTGEWEHRLKEIEAGRLGYPEFMADIRRMVADGVTAVKAARASFPPPPPRPAPTDGDGSGTARPGRPSIGVCPVCGGDVVEMPRSFGCTRWRPEAGGCKFAVWKETSGAVIDETTAREVLTTGRTARPLTFTRRSGGTFEAWLTVAAGRVVVSHAEPAPTETAAPDETRGAD